VAATPIIDEVVDAAGNWTQKVELSEVYNAQRRNTTDIKRF